MHRGHSLTLRVQADKIHAPGNFLPTGSRLYKLMRDIQESLAGQVALLRLFVYPAAAPEIFECIWKGSMSAYSQCAITNCDVFYAGYLSYKSIADDAALQ